MKIIVELIRESKSWVAEKYINIRYIKNILHAALTEIPACRAANSFEVALLLTSDANIQKLNHQFLGKNKPTNVLSFPDEDRDYKSISGNSFLGEVLLGDIAIAFETIHKEAKEFNIPLQNHFTHMIVHAILHLLGYDHESDEDADMMQELEIRILKKLDIKTPPIYD